jgi:hypothetical protein
VSCEVGTGFVIPEDGIFHSHGRGNLKSYIALTAALYSGEVMSPLRYELGLLIQKTAFFMQCNLPLISVTLHGCVSSAHYIQNVRAENAHSGGGTPLVTYFHVPGMCGCD